MHFQVKDASVLSPPPYRHVPGLSSDNSPNGRLEIGGQIISHEHGAQAPSGKFGLTAKKELFESSIDQFDAALPVEYYDSKGTILDQGIQVSGLFLKITCDPVLLAYRRSGYQTDSGQNQHE